jgi:FtsP/CotA-like multicopper oxidase with cupredoxin domain
MPITRRQFVAGAAALSAAGPTMAFASEAAPELHAAPHKARLVSGNYPETAVWGYNGGTPGPVLRVRQGGRIARRFINGLSQASTVHWHGIRIANAMDGVPDLTQPVVKPGESFDYDFTVPDAGTYWYHPHNRTWEQMARGLYGALIVEEPEPPKVDRDEVMLIDDWRLNQSAAIDESFGAMMDWSHGGRMGNWITVNGKDEYRLPVQRFERLRLRLVNTANARIFYLGLRGMNGWVMALDGQPLDFPVGTGRMTLAPAQRIDLIVDVIGDEGTVAGLEYLGRDASHIIAAFDISGQARGERPAMPDPRPANPVPPPGDIARAKLTQLHMEGGAMGGMRGAMMGGRMMDMRMLVDNGRVWAFNGMAEMPDKPLLTASAGETVRIAMVNDTGWPHAMHLHGHHFRQVLSGGGFGPLRDTLLIEPEKTTEIAFVADNPGDWLLHCHMLEHSAAGMMTWLRVA